MIQNIKHSRHIGKYRKGGEISIPPPLALQNRRLQGFACQHPVRFQILIGGFLHHIGRKFRTGSGLVPVERFEIIADVLLVETDRAGADLILIRRPEPARIRSQDFVDQNDPAVDFTEFELGVRYDDAAFFRIIPRRAVDFQRELAKSRRFIRTDDSADLLERDRLIMITDFSLGGGSEQRLVEL